MGSNKKYCTGIDLSIGDKFTFKNMKTIYIFEGYDSLRERFVAYNNYYNVIICFDENSKLEKL